MGLWLLSLALASGSGWGRSAGGAVNVTWQQVPEPCVRFGSGYSAVILDGDSTAQDFIVAANGTEDRGFGERGTSLTCDRSATVRCIRPEMRWTSLVDDRWVTDAGIGGLVAMSNLATINTTAGTLNPVAQAAFNIGGALWL